MASTFNWCEDNGTQTGSPLHGTTRSGFGADTHFPTEVNWKNADNCTANSGTVYSAAPILAGNNSFTKYQYGHFTGTFNTISAGLWTAHDDASSFGTGITLKGASTGINYLTPTTTTTALTTDFTSQVPVASGLAVYFSTVGPESATVTTTLSAAGYSSYFETQLQTTTSAAPGDTTTVTSKFQYQEN